MLSTLLPHDRSTSSCPSIFSLGEGLEGSNDTGRHWTDASGAAGRAKALQFLGTFTAVL